MRAQITQPQLLAILRRPHKAPAPFVLDSAQKSELIIVLLANIILWSEILRKGLL